ERRTGRPSCSALPDASGLASRRTCGRADRFSIRPSVETGFATRNVSRSDPTDSACRIGSWRRLPPPPPPLGGSRLGFRAMKTRCRTTTRDDATAGAVVETSGRVGRVATKALAESAIACNVIEANVADHRRPGSCDGAVLALTMWTTVIWKANAIPLHSAVW